MKIIKQLLMTLVVAAIAAIGWLTISFVFNGRNDDFYQSEWFFGLTPFGIAVTVLLVIVVLIISRLTNKSDKQHEKEFARYIADKKNKQ
jgi:biotin transporter BioY